MDEREAFFAELVEFVRSIEELSPDERARVSHLVEHRETGFAMLTLAWIIVDGDKAVPRRVIERVKDYLEVWPEAADSKDDALTIV